MVRPSDVCVNPTSVKCETRPVQRTIRPQETRNSATRDPPTRLPPRSSKWGFRESPASNSRSHDSRDDPSIRLDGRWTDSPAQHERLLPFGEAREGLSVSCVANILPKSDSAQPAFGNARRVPSACTIYSPWLRATYVGHPPGQPDSPGCISVARRIFVCSLGWVAACRCRGPLFLARRTDRAGARIRVSGKTP